jgi:hypothetical protein
MSQSSDLQRQVKEARDLYPEVSGYAQLGDEDLVWMARRTSQSDAFLAEVGRRQVKAAGDLKEALEKTSGRLYALNVVLAIYSVALLVATVVAILLHR